MNKVINWLQLNIMSSQRLYMHIFYLLHTWFNNAWSRLIFLFIACTKQISIYDSINRGTIIRFYSFIFMWVCLWFHRLDQRIFCGVCDAACLFAYVISLAKQFFSFPQFILSSMMPDITKSFLCHDTFNWIIVVVVAKRGMCVLMWASL